MKITATTKLMMRYILLTVLTVFAVDVTYVMITYATGVVEISTQAASILTAVQGSVLGTWGYVVKKIYETKVSE